MTNYRFKISQKIVVTDDWDRDFCLLYSCRTGKLIKFPKKSWLNLMEEYQASNGAGIPYRIDIGLLISAELLVPIGQNENCEVIERRKQADKTEASLYDVILPHGNCNLACEYCGQKHREIMLSKKLCDLEIRRVRSVLETKRLNSFVVGWFGAEPLLGLEAIRYLTQNFIKICREVGVTYGSTMVTNGLLLRENVIRELVEDLCISAIELTIDGMKDAHNRQRKSRTNEDSFTCILKNLHAASKLTSAEQVSLRVRCNVSSRNVESAKELINYLVKIGLASRIFLYCSPIYSWGPPKAQKYGVSSKEWGLYDFEFIQLLTEKGFSTDIVPEARHTGCTYTRANSRVIGPDGRLYLCTEVPLVPEYEHQPKQNGTEQTNNASNWLAGSLESFDLAEDEEIHLKTWYNKLLQNQLPCATCKFYGVCYGGCPKKCQDGTPQCPPFVHNIASRMQLASKVGRVILG